MELKGYGLGAGYKHNLGHRVFGFTEVQKTWSKQKDVPITVDGQTDLDSYDTASATAVVGLGVRF